MQNHRELLELSTTTTPDDKKDGGICWRGGWLHTQQFFFHKVIREVHVLIRNIMKHLCKNQNAKLYYIHTLSHLHVL